MNLKRILTAVIGLPFIVMTLVFANIYIVDLVFALIAIMCLHEYMFSFKEKAKPVFWVGYIACLLISIINIIPEQYKVITTQVSICTIIAILFTQSIITNMKYSILDIAITLFGICYIPLFLIYIPKTIGAENGNILIWYLFIASWGTDIFAYTIGKKFGKHKFSKISPNKSIEGCIGGAVGAILIALIYTYAINKFFGMNINYIFISGIALLLSIIGQIGDFAASSIKRYVGIKDFSNLLPGHGGMLDRFDSLIFIAPFAYFLLVLL